MITAHKIRENRTTITATGVASYCCRFFHHLSNKCGQHRPICTAPSFIYLHFFSLVLLLAILLDIANTYPTWIAYY